MGSLFEKLRGRPLPTEEAGKHDKSQSLERLLSWLVNNWAKDTITARQIRVYGPYPLRNETQATLDLAQGLVERGWLFPVAPRRHDSREWKIGRISQRPKP